VAYKANLSAERNANRTHVWSLIQPSFTICIAVEDRMFWGKQDFYFVQILSLLPKFPILPKLFLNFTKILPKFNQICPKLIDFAYRRCSSCSCLLSSSTRSPTTPTIGLLAKKDRNSLFIAKLRFYIKMSAG